MVFRWKRRLPRALASRWSSDGNDGSRAPSPADGLPMETTASALASRWSSDETLGGWCPGVGQVLSGIPDECLGIGTGVGVNVGELGVGLHLASCIERLELARCSSAFFTCRSSRFQRARSLDHWRSELAE